MEKFTITSKKVTLNFEIRIDETSITSKAAAPGHSSRYNLSESDQDNIIPTTPSASSPTAATQTEIISLASLPPESTTDEPPLDTGSSPPPAPSAPSKTKKKKSTTTRRLRSTSQTESPPSPDTGTSPPPPASSKSQDKKIKSTTKPLRTIKSQPSSSSSNSVLPPESTTNKPSAPAASSSSHSRDKKKSATAPPRRRSTPAPASRTQSPPSSSASVSSHSVQPTVLGPAVLDDIISRLLDRPGKLVTLTEAEIGQLCIAGREIFLRQSNLLELVAAPFNICGDIHGQYSDLLRLFEYGGFPPATNYLFLGDYVDYGKQSIETICLLLAYKIKYPENFFLLRGCHECASMNRINGFYDECKRRYNVSVWKIFNDCFNCLPAAALIDDKILCMHGGLSPDLTSLDQIRNIPRPTDVPDSGLLCDLLWSDPARDVQGWGMNDRGASYTFGPDKVSEFMIKHDLNLICRAHQMVKDGYEFFADRQLVTIFSAPNYVGEYDNAGAMMCIDETLMCSFRILKLV